MASVKCFLRWIAVVDDMGDFSVEVTLDLLIVSLKNT